ncbi:hypothetical protein ACLOJK_016772 [Asimina triloba]
MPERGECNNHDYSYIISAAPTQSTLTDPVFRSGQRISQVEVARSFRLLGEMGWKVSTVTDPVFHGGKRKSQLAGRSFRLLRAKGWKVSTTSFYNGHLQIICYRVSHARRPYTALCIDIPPGFGRVEHQ